MELDERHRKSDTIDTGIDRRLSPMADLVTRSAHSRNLSTV
jgi:hypothetical protein